MRRNGENIKEISTVKEAEGDARKVVDKQHQDQKHGVKEGGDSGVAREEV